MLYLASQSPRRAELLRQIGVKFDMINGDIDETPIEHESPSETVARLSRQKAIKGYQQLTNIQGTSKNSDFFVSARKHRTDDCMDAGGRVKQDARTENRSVYDIHEESLPRERSECFGYSSTELTPQSRKKTIFRGALQADDWVLASDTLIEIQGRVIGKPESENHCREILHLLSGKEHQVLTAIALVGNKGEIHQTTSYNRIKFRNIRPEEIEQYCQLEEPKDKAGAYAIQGKAAIFIENLQGSYSSVMGLPLYETAQLLQKVGFNLLDQE
jgi:septum formation protein